VNGALWGVGRGLRHVNSHGAQLIRCLPPSSHGSRVVPVAMSRSTETTKGGARDEMALDVEDVVNSGMDGDEALG
jgi:hypothetical protein